MDNARSAIQSAGDNAASVANDLGRRARDVADKASHAASRASDWMRDQRLAEQATTYVTQNPAKAIGVAVAAGALLAFLLTRRRDWP